MAEKKKVLVLFSLKSHKRGYIERIFTKLQGMAHSHALELWRGSLREMHIHVKNNELHLHESLTDTDLTAYDVIYVELWSVAQEEALALGNYCKKRRIPFFSHEVLYAKPITKTGELVTLAGQGLSLPNSFMSSNEQILKRFRHNPPLKYPLVVKAINGMGGRDNFLVHDYSELENVIGENSELRFVAQEFVPNDSDYRCLIIGGKIVAIIKRTRRAESNTHLNNTSKGAVAELLPLDSLPEHMLQDVMKAAKLLHREHLAGVDLLIDSNSGKHYILEVNPNPEIETGSEVDTKTGSLFAYMHELADKGRMDE